ncbi:BnaA07g09580D [Brassica napus]|uniref:Glutathione S-transferase n=1 Tax=Brassica napus TaxID=3708 RepID=A0A078GKN8_BRANA|nr:BnaA07g09580D [Brassica napus]
MAQNDTVKLIGSWVSPFSIRARAALHLKSVKYEYSDEPDSLNIVQYIDEAWSSGPSILPSHPVERANARFWAIFIDEKIITSLEAVGGAKDDEGRMAAAGKLMENLAILEEAFQKNSKGLGFFGGENIGFLDLACGTLLGPVSVIEAFSGVKFLRQETTPGLIQWAEKFRAHEAVKPNMPTPEEFVAFAKKKFNVEWWAFS